MKRTIRILTMAITLLVLSLTNIMAEESAELTLADLDILIETIAEDAVIMEEWMVEAPIIEQGIELQEWMFEAPVTGKKLELQEWMIKPFDIKGTETAVVLEDWMFNFS